MTKYFGIGMTSTRSRLLVGLVAVSSAAVTACGSGSSTAATSTISIGAQLPLTGTLASYGANVLTGVDTGLHEVNSNGGVRGQKLALTVQDDGGDAVDALPAFRTLLLSHPVAIFGLISNTFPSVATEFDQNHIVDFGLLGGTAFYKLPYKYVYHAVVADPSVGSAMADYAISSSWTQCSAIFGADASSQTLSQAVLGPYQTHGGTVLADVSVTPAQSSYRSELAVAFAKHPQCLFLQTDPTTSKTLFADASQLGYANVPIIGSDEFVGADECTAIGGAIASKYLTGVAEAAPNSPAVTHYAAIYQQLYHTTPTSQQAGLYDSVIIAALAMTAANSTNPQVWNPFVRKVTGGSGEVVYTYAAGVAALKAGKQIRYSGAYTSNWDYNQYGDVFTDFDMSQYDATCTTAHSVFHITAADVAKFG
jgi:ABC-type branched-subunit amino acid transport system substrate-binding protein